MARRSPLPFLALALWVLAAPARSAEVCDPGASNGPVSLMILANAAKVQALATSLHRGAAVVARDRATVIFDDGRVITADVEGATEHLNRLGWSRRRIDVVATFRKARARPSRRRG